MVFKKRIHSRIWFRVSGFFVLIGFIQIATAFLLNRKPELAEDLPFRGKQIYSPYTNVKSKWIKTAFHLHSDRDGFSPFRSTPEEIQKQYLDKNYDLVGITDYLKISGKESKDLRYLPGYEWGRDFNKKHILALGSETVVKDFFPIYASVGNIQWTIDQMQKTKAFVVISHPSLEGSISKDAILTLRGIDAIEVFSPYGDSFQDWIDLLDRGVPMLATSGDDLHYFPGESIRALKLPLYQRIFHELTFSDQNEGETFTRYILLNTDSLEISDLIQNLKKGNYVSVVKIVDYMEDPKITELKLEQNRILVRFPEKFLNIEFIGKGGTVLKKESGESKSDYVFREEDQYVIVKAIFPSGYIYSNPFYRKQQSEVNSKHSFQVD
ncbi:PHP domain-containing protein [Leptospira sp. WS92.C1]